MFSRAILLCVVLFFLSIPSVHLQFTESSFPSQPSGFHNLTFKTDDLAELNRKLRREHHKTHSDPNPNFAPGSPGEEEGRFRPDVERKHHMHEMHKKLKHFMKTHHVLFIVLMILLKVLIIGAIVFIVVKCCIRCQRRRKERIDKKSKRTNQQLPQSSIQMPVQMPQYYPANGAHMPFYYGVPINPNDQHHQYLPQYPPQMMPQAGYPNPNYPMQYPPQPHQNMMGFMPPPSPPPQMQMQMQHSEQFYPKQQMMFSQREENNNHMNYPKI